MPTYEYHCGKCGKDFSIRMHIADHDSRGTTCPACNGTSIVQRYSPFYVKTSKKS